MGYRAHVSTKRIIEYGVGFGNYAGTELLNLILELQDWMTERAKTDILYNHGDEFSDDFCMNTQVYLDIIKNPEYEEFKKTRTKQENDWLRCIEIDVCNNKEHLLDNGYIKIVWF